MPGSESRLDVGAVEGRGVQHRRVGRVVDQVERAYHRRVGDPASGRRPRGGGVERAGVGAAQVEHVLVLPVGADEHDLACLAVAQVALERDLRPIRRELRVDVLSVRRFRVGQLSSLVAVGLGRDESLPGAVRVDARPDDSRLRLEGRPGRAVRGRAGPGRTPRLPACVRPEAIQPLRTVRPCELSYRGARR